MDNLLKIIDEHIDNSRIFQAQKLLDKIDVASLTERQYAYYCLFSGQVLIRTSIDGFEKPLIHALNYFKEHNISDMIRRTNYFCSWIPFSVGKYNETIEQLVESYGDFKQRNETRWMMRTLNQMANVYHLSGAVVTAIDCLEKCAELNKQLSQPSSIPACFSNIATVYYLSGYFCEAIKRYESLLPQIGSISIERQRHFFFNYGMASAMRGDIKHGISLLKKAHILSRTSSRGEIYYKELLAWIYIIDGQYKKAEGLLIKCLQYSKEVAPDSHILIRENRLLADSYLGQEKYAEAENTVKKALEISEGINRRVEIASCHRILARIEYQKGHNEKSREWYDRAFEELSYISSRYELAVTRYFAAVCGPYDQTERLAMLYLAREYFDSEKIQNYTLKIDRELTRLADLSSPQKIPDNGAPVYLAVHQKSRKIVDLAQSIAPSLMTVLLAGPTGSGKDQMAKYIHHLSGRKGKFVSINSAAIPETMIESELFGHQKGAYTGANNNRCGLFEEADGGTLYLNEIAESTPGFQAKLLEAIETRTVRHLGSNKPITIDIRFIASTNRDLKKLIREGKFREDLYHRLHEVEIAIPPLSQRSEDIPVLIRYFLEENGGITSSATDTDLAKFCQLMKKRSWPGNIRELRSEIERLCHLAKCNISLMLEMTRSENGSEYEQLLAALEKTGWNRSATARLFNVSEGTIRYRIKKYNISFSDS